METCSYKSTKICQNQTAHLVGFENIDSLKLGIKISNHA